MREIRPPAISSAVRDRMAKQKRRDTKPEIEIRRALFSLGHRYRVNYPVPAIGRRTIDIAFTRARIAVFVDGCFWHGCPEHFVPPKNNADWWAQKIEANRERDAVTRRRLSDLGWKVIAVWEHEDSAAALGRIVEEIAHSADRTLP